MVITASPMLLLIGGALLLAAVYARVPPDRWAEEASRMLASEGERVGWSLLTNLWLGALLAAFWHYANVRRLLTAGTSLGPPWRDYLTVAVLAAATYALRWLWLAALRWLLAERLALRAMERWRLAQHTQGEDR